MSTDMTRAHHRRAPRRGIALLAAAALSALSACSGLALLDAPPTATPTTPPSPTASAAPSTPTTPTPVDPVPEYVAGVELAAALPLIDPAAAVPDYRRDEFGDGWIDTDGNGCRQRDDVLARDLVDVTLDADACTVLSGTLNDPYTATTIAFAHDRIGGDSQAVQIDHVISLSAAHAGGAWSWSRDERIAFANDLDNLLAVDGPTNASKSDRGPADWMPPNTAYACLYALDYATIASAWDLAVAERDRAVLVDVLTECAA